MIVILGGSGYVGQAFVRFCRRSALPCRVISRKDYDYNSEEGVLRLLEREKPEVLINFAGFTGKPNVDACESQKEACLEGNVALPGLLKRVLKGSGICWGHVSSGCVFTGFKGQDISGGFEGYGEEDSPNFSFRHHNCSFYSGSKVLGEEALGYREVREADGGLKWLGEEEDFYIWRLRMPFDEIDGERNYLSKVMRYSKLLEARNSFSHLGEFVEACWQCVDRKVPKGIYHMTNPGSITTREVTSLILEEAKFRKKNDLPSPFPEKFDFFRSEEEFMKLAALAPRSNCVLDSSKLAANGIRMRPVAEAMRESLRHWVSQPREKDINA